MALITVNNLTFSYPSSYTNIFENVSFSIETDWRLGFVGRNGRGKTTFLKLLLNEYEYSGSINTGNIKFCYFPFKIDNQEETTLDIISSFCKDKQEWEIIKELSLLKVDKGCLYQSFNLLSKGEQTKCMLAILFLGNNDFLLIDEPTNHLDNLGREIIANYLKSKSGFILVSHDRNVLDKCVDHILSINKSNIEINKGNFTTYMNNFNNQQEYEKRTNEKLEKKIDQLKIAQEKTAHWSDLIEAEKDSAYDSGYVGHCAALMMQKSKAIERRREREIEKTSSLLKNIETIKDLKIHPLTTKTKTLLTIYDLSINYDDNVIFNNLTFQVEKGDRVAIKGKNGSGKSSLIKLLLGQNISYSGTLKKEVPLTFSYVSQEMNHLKGTLDEYIEETKIDVNLFRSILQKLGIEAFQFDNDLSKLSDGQKKKILIATSLCQQAHIYLWDEPLNYLDIYARMQIENLLLTYKPTIIFIEHDELFCKNVATKIIELTSNNF